MEWHSVLLSAVGSQKGSNPYPSHFFGKKILFTLDVCVGAHVCLETANIDPNSGLFVGAIGKVIDIVYDKSVGPNGDVDERLPKYIVVDFPSFKPPPGIEPWDKKNPMVSKDSHDREFVTSPLTIYMRTPSSFYTARAHTAL